MPVTDKKDAKDLDAAFDALIAASDAQREQRLRAIFVEKLDFAPVAGATRLKLGECKLRVDGNDVAGPVEAVRIAQRDGVHVVWVPLSDPKLRARNARAALKAVEDSGLAGQHLLVLSAPGCNLWHLIWSPEPGPRRVLRRMAIEVSVPRRTIVMQLAGISFDVKAGLRKAIDDAFDVEPVTKEFFRTYRDVFGKVMGMISGVPDEDNHRLFCQTLFNRLMFIYFLQQKKWLSLHGNINYLRALYAEFEKKKTNDENFYNDRLKHLFFTMLNSASSVDLSKSLKETFGDVPFLNGGLFEETDLDKECAKAKVPDNAFDLIFDSLFERFNFTVSESTPYDIQVAVDPEMLGKVFEELVTGRHETGSYYTPRPVVSFMCREALKGYLSHAVDAADAGAIAKLVDEHDVSGINLAQAAAVVQALDRIAVVDPACGSGAYLLGMLHELIELKQELFSQRLQRDPDQLYQMKLDVIERNIYGVDIDEFATNIAMLRLWLSLSIEFEGKKPKPLPNLDFKILCGDSLTAPNPRVAPDLFRTAVHDAADELARLKAEYMRLSGQKKGATKKQIIAAEAALEETLTSLGGAAPARSVDWRVDFAEVFEQGGFDVVLANPPYVRADAQFKHLKPNEEARSAAVERWKQYRAEILTSKVYASLFEKWDLFVPFVERAFQLLRVSGQMVFIIPDAFNSSKYTSKIQEFMRASTDVRRIDFCSDIPLFEAGVRNTILHVMAVKVEAQKTVRVRRWGETADDFDRNADVLAAISHDPSARELFSPMAANSTSEGMVPLGNICYVSYGLAVSSDEKLHPGEFVTEDVLSPIQDATHPKPYTEGKDLERWIVRRVRYLEWGTKRAPAHFRRKSFPEMHEVPQKLLALRVSGDRLVVAYDEQQLYSNHTAVTMVPWYALEGVRNRSLSKRALYADEGRPAGDARLDRDYAETVSRTVNLRYVLAIVNSKNALQWIRKRRRGKLDIYPDDWKDLPVPIPATETQNKIAHLVTALQTELRASSRSSAKAQKLEEQIEEQVDLVYAAASQGAVQVAS